jgi:large subunit ribosomal protein L23
MALFGKKTEEKKNAQDTKVVEKVAAKKPTANLSRPSDRNLEGVIVRPHMTEKAVGLSGKNVYTFEVSARATKFDVRDAIAAVYGVTPVKVNIVKKAPRTSMSRARGRKVSVKGMKKAYVYLKKGDSINMV